MKTKSIESERKEKDYKNVLIYTKHLHRLKTDYILVRYY